MCWCRKNCNLTPVAKMKNELMLRDIPHSCFRFFVVFKFVSCFAKTISHNSISGLHVNKKDVLKLNVNIVNETNTYFAFDSIACKLNNNFDFSFIRQSGICCFCENNSSTCGCSRRTGNHFHQNIIVRNFHRKSGNCFDLNCFNCNIKFKSYCTAKYT